jgi:uncharacterized protein (TIGR03084 family)
MSPSTNSGGRDTSLLDGLCADLDQEQRSLDEVLEGLDPTAWSTPTPAKGWDVRDSVSHLCFFEEAAVLALTDPPAFDAHRRELLEQLASADPGADTPDVALGRSEPDPAALLRRWQKARSRYQESVRAVEPGVRVEWYGPAMSPASFTTARIQEAWAHGVDVRDALGLPIDATPRLRHVLHLGYSARRFTFASHGVDDPGDPVRMEATAPDGSRWVWGPEDAADVLSGSALDLALVFTQRRHASRTGVSARGRVAELWLPIAQSFAGPPTVTATGR